MRAVDIQVGSSAGIQREGFVQPVGILRHRFCWRGMLQISDQCQIFELVHLRAVVSIVLVDVAGTHANRRDLSGGVVGCMATCTLIGVGDHIIESRFGCSVDQGERLHIPDLLERCIGLLVIPDIDKRDPARLAMHQ